MIEINAPQRRIHTTINEEDYIYMKKHQLRAAHLIRAMIRDHRVHTNDPDANPTMREMQEKIKRLMTRLSGVMKTLEAELPKKHFEKIMQKI